MQKKVVLFLIGGAVGFAVITIGVLALLMNIMERKVEGKQQPLRFVEVTEQDTDPALWAKNWPREYDGYKRTVDTARTKYGGSESFQHLEEDPVWKKIFNGYAFGTDYREERGHAYSLEDQKLTERTKQFKQPGACLQCHAGGIKAIYEKAGDGDMIKGFEKVNAMPIHEALGLTSGHPIACVDCHDPKTMELRVTRPGFIEGIRKLKEKEGIPNFDPNTMATRQEMRSFVCGQCHVEYFFKGSEKRVTYPWAKGLKVEEIEKFYEEDGHRDWTHGLTGAKVLKAQHPEFELWSQGIHAKSGVTCVDCHMPYKREGANKITDHHIRSPMLNVSRSCLPCHHFSEKEMMARVETIQDRTKQLLDRAEKALEALIDKLAAAKQTGLEDARMNTARELQRQAQWRLDFISAENSMGFHAPQESARILAEAIDYARQGELALVSPAQSSEASEAQK